MIMCPQDSKNGAEAIVLNFSSQQMPCAAVHYNLTRVSAGCHFGRHVARVINKSEHARALILPSAQLWPRSVSRGGGRMNHRLSANPRSALNVVVGSKNPVKIDAVREALRTVAPSLSVQVVGVSANSGVPSQPFGDTETLKGALVRCRSVMEEVSTASAFPVANTPPLPDLVIAIEGGVGWQDRILSESSGGGSKPECLQDGDLTAWTLECFAWVAVRTRDGAESTARSASFPLPRAISEKVQAGMELGEADDEVFGRTRSGQGTGTIGRLTHGAITRTEYYRHAVAMALVPLLNPDLYPGFAMPDAGIASAISDT